MPKLLLVEDNEMNRDMLSRRLIKRGYDVAIAVDGQEAIDMASSQSPEIILLDMSLPIIDGWEVARRLKGDAGTSGIPIIALTAHAMDGDRDKCLQAGCEDYDTKPVDLKRLMGKIKALVDSSRAEA
jgi:two-component system cell cycle response regulator DivK